MAFVKASETTTTVAKSKTDIMALLARHGGTDFGYSSQASGRTVIHFSYPRTPEDRDPEHQLRVSIPIDVPLVRARLIEHLKANKRNASKASTEQAERVAWRIVYLLIDAALSAVAIGAQTAEDAFHAHLIVRTDDGVDGRLSDYVMTLRGRNGADDRRLPGTQQFLALAAGLAK